MYVFWKVSTMPIYQWCKWCKRFLVEFYMGRGLTRNWNLFDTRYPTRKCLFIPVIALIGLLWRLITWFVLPVALTAAHCASIMYCNILLGVSILYCNIPPYICIVLYCNVAYYLIYALPALPDTCMSYVLPGVFYCICIVIYYLV